MNPVKFLGIMCMCFGVATMFLGTAMVPVAAPVWADVYEDPPGGGPPGGGGGKKCLTGKCSKCGSPAAEPSTTCYTYDPGTGFDEGNCEESNLPGHDCEACSGNCEAITVEHPEDGTQRRCICRRIQ